MECTSVFWDNTSSKSAECEEERKRNTHVLLICNEQRHIVKLRFVSHKNPGRRHCIQREQPEDEVANVLLPHCFSLPFAYQNADSRIPLYQSRDDLLVDVAIGHLPNMQRRRAYQICVLFVFWVTLAHWVPIVLFTTNTIARMCKPQ